MTCVRIARARRNMEDDMTGIDKLMCRAAGVVLLAAISMTPAKAQFGGGGGGGEDMMT